MAVINNGEYHDIRGVVRFVTRLLTSVWSVGNVINKILEKNILPDFVLRFGIRRLLRQRLREERKDNVEAQQAHLMRLIDDLKKSPIAVHTEAANEQHYEVPADFYRIALGRHLKYSSGYWGENVSTLDQAEETMLAMTCERAQLSDGQDVLELGCGWGSLTLYMAAKYPNSRITAVSNSASQKAFIEEQARARGLSNVSIITADMKTFRMERQFDRIVSVEMFEHMRNYQKLFEKIAGWMKPDARLFVHIFSHREFTYPFEVRDETDWMAKYFFTGGIMPGDNLYFYFNDHLKIKRHWRISGTHYQKTAEAWLRNIDHHKPKVLTLFREVYGKDQAVKWYAYWRIFFMACAELWGFRKGQEWFVSHYLFEKV